MEFNSRLGRRLIRSLSLCLTYKPNKTILLLLLLLYIIDVYIEKKKKGKSLPLMLIA